MLDTAALSNGTHTIAWVVSDNEGSTEGLGSRFFTVSNGTPAAMTAADTQAPAPPDVSAVRALPLVTSSLQARLGWNLETPYTAREPDASGQVLLRGEEVGRFEIVLGTRPDGHYTGFLRTGPLLAPLPIGSTLDPSSGTFTWAPGVGFVGAYDFVFVEGDGTSAVARREVRPLVQPKGSGAVGPQVVIDTPTRQQDVGQPFVLAGWAADLRAAVDSGITTIHVWAYPLAGGAPTFLGVADLGGRRPDVAAVYGEQFQDSGYGLIVSGLTPGNYDLAVFPASAAAGDFLPASVVRVTVR